MEAGGELEVWRGCGAAESGKAPWGEEEPEESGGERDGARRPPPSHSAGARTIFEQGGWGGVRVQGALYPPPEVIEVVNWDRSFSLDYSLTSSVTPHPWLAPRIWLRAWGGGG